MIANNSIPAGKVQERLVQGDETLFTHKYWELDTESVARSLEDVDLDISTMLDLSDDIIGDIQIFDKMTETDKILNQSEGEPPFWIGWLEIKGTLPFSQWTRQWFHLVSTPAGTQNRELLMCYCDNRRYRAAKHFRVVGAQRERRQEGRFSFAASLTIEPYHAEQSPNSATPRGSRGASRIVIGVADPKDAKALGDVLASALPWEQLV
mmetsp:Transcript_61388/g.164893  ORF Transcript_61388/g.164893 Transcript_61388/m.164893 type:complete len:208 (-) Transcript_61388:96-719(-)|eukprot:CAMPEP_0113671592 /NCGR_PEP_ID=MMETSP0038_2-20120614/5787_1 /TAXON_ID=2898 /ORGANISM="Cryptomonas paramecium" /LENGTH=207 /DNA_ID=CAMNT_0000587755 /DNA_START=52 /DNA_END=675 /DNA_ORIENTATION=+ /assembly_acc=CAM_ASM_000170